MTLKEKKRKALALCSQTRLLALAIFNAQAAETKEAFKLEIESAKKEMESILTEIKGLNPEAAPDMGHWLGRPQHPFREALEELTGQEPPKFVSGYGDASLDDVQKMKLQDWCATHARPFWATGLSMYEAAELIVAGAVENGNIPPEGK